MLRVLGQFWRLLKLCIAGEGGKFGLVLYAVVLALELSQILVSLRMIEWSKTFYDALQQVDGATALAQVGIFFIIVFIGVGLTLLSSFTRQHLEIRWRRSLTNAALTRWLGNRSYLKLERERKGGIDNPDQRIAEDCRFFLAGPMGEHGGGIGLIPLSLDLITNIVAIFSYRPLADLVAASNRLDSFLNATDGSSGARPGIVERPSPNGSLGLSGLELFAPDGRRLLGLDGLEVRPGEAVWLAGPSGLGKTTLLKTVAGTWPHATGRIETPAGATGFLPQDAYLPIGGVLDAVAYPRNPSDIPVAEREAALRAVGLGHLILSDASEAAKGLSGGEQQRLALARLLLLKPQWAFLDEATSALDVAAERQLLGLLRRELPGTAFIIVAHREPAGLGTIRKVELAAAPAITINHPVPA